MYKKILISILSLFLISCSFLNKDELTEEQIELKSNILNFDNIQNDSLIELYSLLIDNKYDYTNEILINAFGQEDVKKGFEFYDYYIFNRTQENSILEESDYQLMNCLDGLEYHIGNIDNLEDREICLGKKGYNKDYEMEFYIDRETTRFYKQAYNQGGNVCSNILDFDYSEFPTEERIFEGIYYIICDSLANKITGQELSNRYLLLYNSINYEVCDYIENQTDKEICEKIIEES